MRIVNTTENTLAKYNYYPNQKINYMDTNALTKVDVVGSKLDVVKTFLKPKSSFYTSYIYLKQGYYYFNLNTNNNNEVYTYSKITLYKSDINHISKYSNKQKFVTAYKNNMRTKKIIYVDRTNYYIINIYINYLSNTVCSIPFNVSCVYRKSNPTNRNDVFNFGNTELNDNSYVKVPDSELKYYIDITNYIYIYMIKIIQKVFLM